MEELELFSDGVKIFMRVGKLAGQIATTNTELQAQKIVEACNNYDRLKEENKAWETTCGNLQAEYEEMASIAYEKSQEVERYKKAIEDMKAVEK